MISYGFAAYNIHKYIARFRKLQLKHGPATRPTRTVRSHYLYDFQLLSPNYTCILSKILFVVNRLSTTENSVKYNINRFCVGPKQYDYLGVFQRRYTVIYVFNFSRVAVVPPDGGAETRRIF